MQYRLFRIPAFLMIAVFFAVSLSSCLTYEEVEFVGVKDVDVESFSMKEAVVKVTVQVKNPNKYKIKITNSDLDLFLNGNDLGKAVIQEKIILEKQSNDSHTFTVKTNIGKAAGALGGLLLGIGRAPELHVKGTIKAKAFGIGKNFPVDVKERVSMPSGMGF